MDATRPLSRYERILALNQEIERLEERIRGDEREVWKRRGESARIEHLEAATGEKDPEAAKRLKENRALVERLTTEIRQARARIERVHRFVEERLGTTLRNRY